MATQSAQISSSQGLVDGSSGSNSANDSKCADSFLSSSPVSLIQSPQGERVRQGPGEPADSIATSLRFRSQPSSFTPVSLGFGGEGISHCTKDKQKNMEGHGIESPFSGSSTLVSSAQSNSAGPKSCSGQLWDDTSPIKTSPVSERIKALEALAAKKSETDIWSDGGFLHFKERHYEKSPTETFSPFQKKVSPDQDSPESPFEVLGDPQRGNDFEDTADWMRAHLPPAPNFDAVPELEIKQTAKFLVSECPREIVETPTATVVVASVPYAFMDDPGEMLQQDDPAYEPIKQTSMEEESEFDMSFLPTAYMWDKQDKPDCDSQGLPNIPTLDESKLPPSPPPPAGFGAPTPPPSPPALQLDASAVKPAPWSSDLEPEEIVDLDSSGESDDTVIEDPVSIQAPVTSSPVPDLENPIAIAPSGMCEKEMQSMKQEKPAVLVPIINVIETEDQALSDEEEAEEGFQVIKDVVKAQPKAPSQISELDKSEQHEDSGTEISNFCQQNAPVDESLSKTSSDFETAICKEQSTIDSAAETSFQNQSLNFNIQTENVHSEDFVSQEITRHSFSDEVECSNAAHYQSFTTEIAKTGNQPSLYTESSDQLLEESSGLQSATIDLAKQTSFSDSTNGLAEHPSLNMHSSPVKCNSDFIQEGLPLLGTPTAQLIQEDMNNTEYVSLFGELDGESCPLNIKGTMDMELSSNIQTNVLSSDSGLPNQSELVSLVNAPHNVDGNTTKVATSYGDDPIVTTEDFLPKPVGQPSPQDFTQDPFSDMQNSPQNVDWEMAELQSDRDYLSEMNSPELEKVDIHAIPGSGSGVFAPCESSGLKPVKQEQYNQQEISPPKEPSTETSDPNSFEPECSVSAATDSFVEFMRECLKSRQDEELIDIGSYRTGGEEFPKTAVLSFQSPPGMVLNMEQERLTICALKELGSSQEEDDNLPFEENDSEVTCKEREVPPLTSSSRTSDTFGAPLPALTSESPLQRSATEEVEGIDAWLADAYHLAEHVLTAILTHLSVQDLVYWKDPKKTGMVFGISLLLLLSLAAFSIISVVSYILLALLLVTISFRIYKSVIQAVQKSSEGHPFKALIEKDVSVPPETFRKYVDISLSYINSALKHASRLFLVEDLVDSIKLAVVMWLLTYVGAVFNGITILILADILLFTVPLFYAKNKAQIDHYVGIARNQVNTLVSKLQKKLPGAKPKSE